MGEREWIMMSLDDSDVPAHLADPGLLMELEPFPGIKAAVLVDRSGRLVESQGIDDPGRLRQVAALVAAMHATAARLSEAAGDPGRARTTVRAGERILLLAPLPWPSPLILLLVLTERGLLEAAPFLEAVMDRHPEDHPSMEVADARDFEGSLERSLQGSPGRSGDEDATASPGSAPDPRDGGG